MARHRRRIPDFGIAYQFGGGLAGLSVSAKAMAGQQAAGGGLGAISVAGSALSTFAALYGVSQAKEAAEEQAALAYQRSRLEMLWAGIDEVYQVEELSRQTQLAWGKVQNTSVESQSWREATLSDLTGPLNQRALLGEQRRRAQQASRMQYEDLARGLDVDRASLAFNVIAQGLQGFQAGLQLQESIEGRIAAGEESEITRLLRAGGLQMFNQKLQAGEQELAGQRLVLEQVLRGNEQLMRAWGQSQQSNADLQAAIASPQSSQIWRGSGEGLNWHPPR